MLNTLTGLFVLGVGGFFVFLVVREILRLIGKEVIGLVLYAGYRLRRAPREDARDWVNDWKYNGSWADLPGQIKFVKEMKQ